MLSRKKFYETSSQKENQFHHAIAFRRQASHHVLRFRRQPDSKRATKASEEKLSLKSNFSAMTPRLVQIIQCSNPEAWYAELLFEKFTVIERCNDFYVVDTWNAYGQLIPEFIKISDTKIIEA